MQEVEALYQFFNAIQRDPRVSVTHIGVYAALLIFWREKGFPSPLHAFSYEVMPIAKLSSPTTYHKSMKDLSDFGYLRYEPTRKRTKGSRIYILANE